MGAVVERLASLGLTVPDVAAPVASYVPAVRSGAHVYTSGQLPFVDGVLPGTGKVGAEVTPEDAQEYAKLCALNVIAAINSIVDLDSVVRVVKLTVFVASAPDFTGQPAVANGASDLIAAAFGAAGSHARSAVGVAVLPLDTPVEVDAIVEVA
ncbi:LysR family transcriptional regulator [Aeromicrobium flavum]|uniref:LysR family transcriptional regulator n=1 Tax=Aeromicrobium flavum TaxID=416568 RepID=A0A512HU08_9ACTN|nr:RidA family protein [Aeromicrobium flavum]GEO88925.1 LysR family transcriptional regulator [Aeromicrobium flavum]